MFLCDIVALVVSLNIPNKGLKVEVWQQVLHPKHDVFKELVIELWCAREHCQVGPMLRQAPVHHSVVLIVGRDNLLFEPLVWLVSHEAESRLQIRWAVHLSMRTIMRAKHVILSYCMLHKRSSVVHVCIDNLATGPLFLCEWLFVDVHDLIPSSHKMMLVERLMKVRHCIANNVLMSDLRMIDRFESFSHGFNSLLL